MQAAVSDAGCGECAEACKVCGIADWRGCEAEDGAGGGSGQGGLVGPAPGSSFSSTVSCGFRVAARSIRGSSLGSSGCFVEANGYMPSASAELPCSSRRLCVCGVSPGGVALGICDFAAARHVAGRYFYFMGCVAMTDYKMNDKRAMSMMEADQERLAEHDLMKRSAQLLDAASRRDSGREELFLSLLRDSREESPE